MTATEITTEITTTPRGLKRPVTLAHLLATTALILVLTVGAAILAAPAGHVGPRGPQGVAGVQGPEGPQGESGPRGYRGHRGRTGKTGLTGASGANGADGATIVQQQACSNDVNVPLPYC